MIAEHAHLSRGTPAYRRATFALFCAGFATFALLYCIQPLLPMLAAHFSVSAASSSLALSLTTLSLAVCLLISGALGISYDLKSSIGTFSPGIEGRIASVDLATVRESGGNTALSVARETFKSKQARFGFDYEKQGKMVSINANAQFVWEFEDGPQLLGANFATGIGPNANFVLDTADHTWAELGVSASFGDGPFQMGFGFDTTIGRDNADARVFRATATYRF